MHSFYIYDAPMHTFFLMLMTSANIIIEPEERTYKGKGKTFFPFYQTQHKSNAIDINQYQLSELMSTLSKPKRKLSFSYQKQG